MSAPFLGNALGKLGMSGRLLWSIFSCCHGYQASASPPLPLPEMMGLGLPNRGVLAAAAGGARARVVPVTWSWSRRLLVYCNYFSPLHPEHRFPARCQAPGSQCRQLPPSRVPETPSPPSPPPPARPPCAGVSGHRQPRARGAAASQAGGRVSHAPTHGPPAPMPAWRVEGMMPLLCPSQPRGLHLAPCF